MAVAVVEDRLLLLALNALVCVGFRLSTRYELDREGEPVSKMLLWFVSYYGERWIGKYWMKPVCGCVICMASIHSTYVYLPAFGLDYWYFPYVLALAGLNGLVGKLM